MSNTKEIREKITSIKNIQKLAKTMEMISASKMNKTQKLMLSSKPYVENLQRVIDHITLGRLEYKHIYLINRDVKSVGYWIISSDRGLAGGLNTNLFKLILQEINQWNKLNVKIKLSIIGSKAITFFKNIDPNMIVSYIDGIGDSPNINHLIGIIKIMTKLYCNNQIDQLYIAYNNFMNTLNHKPCIFKILPITINKEKKNILTLKNWDYLYEPDSQMLLDILLNRYVESQVYQKVLENLSSEQSARMVAMKTASDNGEILITDLKLLYNKLRQAKITQELAEIISGASVI